MRLFSFSRLVVAASLVLLFCAASAASGEVVTPSRLPGVPVDPLLSRAFDDLRAAFTRHGAFVHPALQIHMSELGSNGLFTGQALPAATKLIEVPNSLALTASVAFESVAPLLTSEQVAGLMDLQGETCGMLDWFTVLYVAFTAYQRTHPVLSHLDEKLPSHEEQSRMHERHEWLDAYGSCPAFFFPRAPSPSASATTAPEPASEDQSFDPQLHSAWARMIALYPATCTSAVCHPNEHMLELINTPMLLDSHHRHIECVHQTQRLVESVDQILHDVEHVGPGDALPPLPALSYELLLWATSMVLSRQQTFTPDLSQPDHVMPALVPFFDLFNSHTTAGNATHPEVYKTTYVKVKGQKGGMEIAARASTRGEIKAGEAHTPHTPCIFPRDSCSDARVCV